MIEAIQHIDELALKFIHIDMANTIFDTVIPFFRNPYFWAPIYLFLLVWLTRQYGIKGVWWCVFFFVTFVFCDYISASIFKPIFHRVRPCNEIDLPFAIRHIVNCGSGFSFPSSHASNHVGFAVFIIFTIGKYHRWVIASAILWAILVCYSQLYVAVHYPSDIIGGAMLGIIIGRFIAAYFMRRFGLGN
jgi:undecaprenyl-diphosphatase